ncbi:MAG: hypothetical protein M3544_00075 [Pseudomonadota bacterium]|nr:hypothetical protein [Pseudomonadota bacterium]
MVVSSLKWRLDAESVRETPEFQGVLSLWDDAELVYIGHTKGNASLRDYSRRFLSLRDQGAVRATHMTWEITVTPKTREGDLLAVYLDKHGVLPLYNRAADLLAA